MVKSIKVNLKYVSFKNDSDYYFKVNNPDDLTSNYEGYENDGKYYPFFKGEKGELLLKIKDKYIDELDIIKDAPFNANIHLKDFKLQDKNKQMKMGFYVYSVIA